MEATTYAPPPQRFEAGVAQLARRPSGSVPPSTTSASSAWTASPPTSTPSPSDCSPAWRSAPGCGSSAPPTRVDRVGAVAFVVEGVHAHDVGQVLDDQGVAVRVGHHCAWPLHRRMGVTATTRATLAAYNTARRGRHHARRARPGARDLRGGQLMDLYQELILEHSKRPAPRRAARAVRRRGAPRQPHLRRRGDPARARRGHRRRRGGPRHLLRRARLLDLAWPRPASWPRRSSGTPCAEAMTTHEAMRTMLTSKGADPGDEERHR